jgi:cytoskeletal protein CcmA (bactofilin family)
VLTKTLNKMFTNKNESMKKGETTAAVNMIGAGTVITGDIYSKGDIRVDGTLKGSVITEGKVVLGREGIIEGDIECRDADISGTIKAKITVSQLLSLKTSAKLNGDIVTNKLSIEPGSEFTGSCSMGAVIKDIKHAEKQEKQEKTA